MAKISIIIPTHQHDKEARFLARLLNSIAEQTFTDYEVLIIKEGSVGKNLNIGIKKAKGELIKIMCQDDWFSHIDALKNIVENFEGDWAVTGCHNNPHPYWTNEVLSGINTIGGLSVITIRNNQEVFFDEKLFWMVDIDFYTKLYRKFGEPTILDSVNVDIGLGDHQLTNIMSDDEKSEEHRFMREKYG